MALQGIKRIAALLMLLGCVVAVAGCAGTQPGKVATAPAQVAKVSKAKAAKPTKVAKAGQVPAKALAGEKVRQPTLTMKDSVKIFQYASALRGSCVKNYIRAMRVLGDEQFGKGATFQDRIKALHENRNGVRQAVARERDLIAAQKPQVIARPALPLASDPAFVTRMESQVASCNQAAATLLDMMLTHTGEKGDEAMAFQDGAAIYDHSFGVALKAIATTYRFEAQEYSGKETVFSAQPKFIGYVAALFEGVQATTHSLLQEGKLPSKAEAAEQIADSDARRKAANDELLVLSGMEVLFVPPAQLSDAQGQLDNATALETFFDAEVAPIGDSYTGMLLAISADDVDGIAASKKVTDMVATLAFADLAYDKFRRGYLKGLLRVQRAVLAGKGKQ